MERKCMYWGFYGHTYVCVCVCMYWGFYRHAYMCVCVCVCARVRACVRVLCVRVLCVCELVFLFYP